MTNHVMTDLTPLLARLAKHLEHSANKLLARPEAAKDRQQVDLMRSLVELAVLLDRARRSELPSTPKLDEPGDFADLLQKRLKPHERWLQDGGPTLEKDVRELDRLLKLAQLRQYLLLERLDVRRLWERLADQWEAEASPAEEAVGAVTHEQRDGGQAGVVAVEEHQTPPLEQESEPRELSVPDTALRNSAPTEEGTR